MQRSSIITEALIIITVVAFAGFSAYLPNAALGAIVITAVVGLKDVDKLQRFYHVHQTDFWLAMTALLGVVLTNVLTGLLITVLLRLVIVLYRAGGPHIVVLGKISHQRAYYGDIGRYPENQSIPGLLIFRLDAPLYFFNANIAKQRMMDLVVSRTFMARYMRRSWPSWRSNRL